MILEDGTRRVRGQAGGDVVNGGFLATSRQANEIKRGFWILDFGFRILDFGFWVIDFGFWIVD